MRSCVVSRLWMVLVAVSFAVTTAQMPGGGGMFPGFGGGNVSMTEITNFGSNPASLKMFMYKPKNLPANSQKVPLLVAIHFCGSSAQMGESWYQLAPKADQYNFYIVYPQNTHSQNCWETASTQTLQHGGGGDGGSIASMVEYMIKTYGVDSTRVYATGFSSGASMTSSVCAVYPNLFEAGATVAGLPPGCVDTAVNKGAQQTCWGGATSKTPAEWGAAVRKAYPDFKGRYPRMMLWHGVRDELLNYTYFLEEIELWQNLHNLSTVAALTNANTGAQGFTLTQYGSNDAHPLLATMISQTATHAIPYNPDLILKFFGLDGSYKPTPTTPVNACATNNGGCSADATCTNPTGANTQATCRCKTGFTGNGQVCTAVVVNACATSNGGCSQDATCTFAAGSATCTCKTGFTGDGRTCTVTPTANACAVNNGGCDPDNGICTVRAGAVTCSCKTGFTKQGNTCVSNGGGGGVPTGGGRPTVNLCATENGGCSEFAKCTATATATRATCRCNDGYEGNGINCVKVDDVEESTGRPPVINYCRTSNGGCSVNAKCRNGANAQTVRCICNAGYEADGDRDCTPIGDAVKTDNASTSKTPIIIGAVAAAVVVIAVVAYLCHRRSSNARFNKDVNMVQTTGGAYQTGCPQETYTQPYPPQSCYPSSGYQAPGMQPPPPMMAYPQPRY